VSPSRTPPAFPDGHLSTASTDTFETLPKRILLDTNVLDCAVKWGPQVFEGARVPDKLPTALADDIAALASIFRVCQRAMFDLVVSPKTLEELDATPDEETRSNLLEYGSSFLGYGSNPFLSRAELRHARDLARRLDDSPFLAPLKDAGDRELVAHAVAFGCDAFCTRDVRSIHRKRALLTPVPLRFLTPMEWWRHLAPWAGLWT